MMSLLMTILLYMGGENSEKTYIFKNYNSILIEPCRFNINNIKKVLRSGDLIYRRGNPRIYNLSLDSYLTKLTKSKYTHVGIYVYDYVYDMGRNGCQKVPLSNWLNESINGEILVQRLKPEYRGDDSNVNGTIWKIITHIQTKWIDGVPFDWKFSLTQEKYYCVELVVRSFAAQKILLCEPVKIGNLPGIEQVLCQTFLLGKISPYIIGRQLSIEDKVFVCGNKDYGLISSKKLDNVFEEQLLFRKK